MLLVKDRKTGMSNWELSEKYDIPRSSIQYIISNYANSSKKRGQEEKLIKRDFRVIKTNISQKYKKNFKYSIPDIIKELSLNISKPTVSRYLKSIYFK